MVKMQENIQALGRLPQAIAAPHRIAALNLPTPDDADSGAPVDLPAAAPGRKREGNLTAEQEKLMIEHLPIVRCLARRIHDRLPQHVSIEDLYSAGVVGLMDALGKFDVSMQVQFRTYAHFRIRGEILDSLRTLDWGPRQIRRKSRAIEQAIQKLTAQFGRPPDELEIAEELGIGLTAYQQLLRDLKGLEIGTLYFEQCEESGNEELVYMPNRPEDDPLFRCLRAEMQTLLEDAIGGLPERERLVITLCYYEETTQKEVAVILGVTESRVSQIHASAVLHLRARLADSAREEPRVGPGRADGLPRVRHSRKSCASTLQESDTGTTIRDAAKAQVLVNRI